MKRFRPALLSALLLVFCGSANSLFAVATIYQFNAFGPHNGFAGTITLDSSSNPSGTSADILSWNITDPLGTFTPLNSTVESGGTISWTPSFITSMKVEFDVSGTPSFGINTTNIFEGTAPPPQSFSGQWAAVPESSNTLLALLMGIGALGAFSVLVVQAREHSR